MHKEDFYWLNEDSMVFLERGYLPNGVGPIERVSRIANRAEELSGIDGVADKIFNYAAKGFYSFSSPIWANFGEGRGLGVSCFNSYIPDDMAGILSKLSEVGIMTKMGGGTSGYFGDIRARGSQISVGGQADGPIRFCELFDKITSVVSQSNVRRGSFAAYLPVEHPDILEFLQIKEIGHPIQEMSFAVTITDKWMNEMIDGDKEKRKIWGKIIQRRYNSGYPYITYIDNINNANPQVYKDKKLKVLSMQLCNEVCLSSTLEESFVCVLSSLNLLHWEEIVLTDAIETMIYLLDAVNEEFVMKTENMPHMESPHRFAKRHRALGMGVLGWHSFLQSKDIPFESMEAKNWNNVIFKTIRERADKATEYLANTLGEPEVLKGYGRRNTHTLAIAPTTSSSFILGQISPSIEPLNSNYFVKKLAKGNFTYKNPFLKEVLARYNKDTDEVWKSILIKGGSVQHLNFLSQKEKNVYKTFGEISQKEIIIQASQRQKYIDQGQSLNLMIPPKTPAKETSQLMIDAWKMGIKGLYYQRSANPAQELARSLNECKNCES